MNKVYVIIRDIVCDFVGKPEIVFVTTQFPSAEKEFNAQVEDACNYAKQKGYEIEAEGDDEFNSWENGKGAENHYNVRIECHPVELPDASNTHDDGAKKKAIGQRLQECIDTVNEIKGSGYWPFASPHPCSTEVNIKKGFELALRGLETALFFHQQMFGKGNHDEMNPPCSIIKQLK